MADVHLGARLGGFEELEDDVEEAFTASVEALLEASVDAIVIAGDLFDRPRPSNRAIRAAVEALRRVVGRGVKVYATLGEHDYPSGGDLSPVHLVARLVGEGVYVPPERLPRGMGPVEVMGRHTFQVGQGHVILLPFIRAARERRRQVTGALLEASRRLASRLGGPRILVAHLGVEGYTYPEDSMVSPAGLEGFDYAALGHVHRRIVESQPITWAYPSSLVPLRADEAEWDMQGGVRGPLLVEVSRGEASVEEIPIEKPRVYAYLRLAPRSRRELVSRVLEALTAAGWRRGAGGKPPLVHLSLTIPARSSLTPRSAVRALREELGVAVRLSRVRLEAPLARAGAEGSPAGGGEVEVIQKLLDPRGRFPESSRLLAEAIVELKNMAARDDADNSTLEEMLDTIVSGAEYEAAWRRLEAAGRGGWW
jgi:DNA repair exonuclease SbcCD nuclease subunit